MAMGDSIEFPANGFEVYSICCKCGRRDGLTTRPQKLGWMPPTYYAIAAVLLCAGLLMSGIFIAAVTQRAQGTLSICDACNKRWNRAQFLRVLGVIGPVILFAEGIHASPRPGPVLPLFLLGIIVAQVLVWFFALKPASIYPTRIEHGRAQLAGFAPEVHQLLAQSPGQFASWDGTTTQPKGWAGRLLLAFLVIVPVIGVVLVSAVVGVRKYIETAKTAEARHEMHRIAHLAQLKYESTGHMCPSQPHWVPENSDYIAARPYQSSVSDWRSNPPVGFACLGYSMDAPQYFQYQYTAFGDAAFRVSALGDLNGNHVMSQFQLNARVENGALVIDEIDATNPNE